MNISQNGHSSDHLSDIGIVIGGSLTQGVDVRLQDGVSIEDVKVGAFISIQGSQRRFLGVVTDMELGSIDDNIDSVPFDISNSIVSEVVSSTSVYGKVKVEPMLALGAETLGSPQPAKTIPSHFAKVSFASESDIQTVFGDESDKHFYIGNPLDMEAKLCLNIEEMVKRSNGVFGKSGTGKTFLARLLLIGILQHGKASNLVFDMHGEYGWRGTSEDVAEVKGLKQLFGSKVSVFSLDPDSAKRRGLRPDHFVQIGYDDIDPEDIDILRETWGLSDIAADTSYSLMRKFGKTWLSEFLEYPGGKEFSDLASELNVQHSTLSALRNRLNRLRRFPFIVEGQGINSTSTILDYLQRGMHVILEFGRYGNNLDAYLLVANLLTRRIHERYVNLTEQASGNEADEPRPLVITIEEAHKFLSPSVARNTIFGTIAREMRKYNVTLLVIDQRPSGIDEEVMSQLGTKISCLLDNEKDTDSVLSGVSGSRKLKSVLARLESNRQALVFGHALPMPVVVHTREYGPETYREFGFTDGEERENKVVQSVDALFGATANPPR